MNIVLMSLFRNSTGYLPRYLKQITELDEALHARGDRLSLIWGEGDSTDNTWRVLNGARFRFNAFVIDCTHGGRSFDSVVDPERFRQLAYAGGKCLAAIPDKADAVVWVESDLVWKAETIIGLLDRLGKIGAIAPSILLRRTGWAEDAWYDTFAFRCQGKQFEHKPPYHPLNTGKLLQMDSVGSCVAMRANYARRVEVDERVIVGICEQINNMGGSVWYDPTLPPVMHE